MDFGSRVAADPVSLVFLDNDVKRGRQKKKREEEEEEKKQTNQTPSLQGHPD